MREQVRVLRQGGRLVVLETTPGPARCAAPARTACFSATLVPAAGRLIAGDASAYTYLTGVDAGVPRACATGGPAATLRADNVYRRCLMLGSVALTIGYRAGYACVLN